MKVRSFGLAAVVAVMAVIGGAWAEESPEVPADIIPFHQRQGFGLTAGAAVHLMSWPGSTNSDNQIRVAPLVEANYFFHPSIGAFVGGIFTKRGFAIDPRAVTANFIDVPFGIVFKGGSWLAEASRNHLQLGMYYSIPVSKKFEGDLDMTSLSNTNNTKGFVGLYVAGTTTFTISDDLGVGYTIFTKIPLGGALEPKSTFQCKWYEVGVGLVASFM